ncbi:MAG: thioredoxin family protein [Pseudomonadota bacterium]
MNRRHLLLAAVAVAVTPMAASADQYVDFSPGVVKDALKDGKTVLVEYAASWCSTCRRQERVINALRAEDPAYDAAITFVKVDWDRFNRHDVAVSRAIPRRSTLVLLRGNDELGRIVAGTSQSQIKGLLDRAL